jgi:N-carbamoylputrescine amidase
MARLKVGVCECPPEMAAGAPAWNDLCRVVSREAPDLFLLNEMPFGPWISSHSAFDQEIWQESCAAHERGLKHLRELGARIVAGSRPMEAGGLRTNQGFLWTDEKGVEDVHSKQYFPDEPGYYEARWFHPGDRHFRIASAGSLRCGFLICTELMFNERARQYGRSGAHIILSPRAVGSASLERWLAATRMAAIVSGAYVISSNRAGMDSGGQVFGGSGWIIDPSGELAVRTSSNTPVVFHEIDIQLVTQAQGEYPCYVKE